MLVEQCRPLLVRVGIQGGERVPLPLGDQPVRRYEVDGEASLGLGRVRLLTGVAFASQPRGR